MFDWNQKLFFCFFWYNKHNGMSSTKKKYYDCCPVICTREKVNWIGLCCPWNKELRDDLVEILFPNIGRQKSPCHLVHLVLLNAFCKSMFCRITQFHSEIPLSGDVLFIAAWLPVFCVLSMYSEHFKFNPFTARILTLKQVSDFLKRIMKYWLIKAVRTSFPHLNCSDTNHRHTKWGLTNSGF